MINSASKPLPSKYVIAHPESYAAFDVSAPPPRAPAVEATKCEGSRRGGSFDGACGLLEKQDGVDATVGTNRTVAERCGWV